MKNKPKTKQPLEQEEVDLLWDLLDKFNILLANNILQLSSTELAEEFEASLASRLKKEGKEFFVRKYEDREIEIGRQFFTDFCRLLEQFINLKGLGVDWDKRRAETLLMSIRSFEKRYADPSEAQT